MSKLCHVYFCLFFIYLLFHPSLHTTSPRRRKRMLHPQETCILSLQLLEEGAGKNTIKIKERQNFRIAWKDKQNTNVFSMFLCFFLSISIEVEQPIHPRKWNEKNIKKHRKNIRYIWSRKKKTVFWDKNYKSETHIVIVKIT